MYSQVVNPIIDVYDGVTNKYLGKARYDLTPETEKALLNFVNYGIIPPAIILDNVELYQPAPDYVSPPPYEKVKRRGVLTALFSEAGAKELVPIEITYSFDTLIRSIPYNNRFLPGSVEFSNFLLEGIKVLKPENNG